jgi:hypothetical protein
MNMLDTPSFDFGIPANSTKHKRRKLTRKKLVFSNAADATLSLGFSKQPVHQLESCSPDSCISYSSASCILSNPILSISMLQDCTSIVNVGPSWSASVHVSSFLPDTGDDDEIETAAFVANDRWFQNRFNEFLVHIKHVPFFPSISMYS